MDRGIAGYLEHLASGGYSYHTIQFRQRLCRALMTFLSPATTPGGWCEVKRQHVLAFLASFPYNPRASSRRTRLVALKGFFRYLISAGLVNEDPTKDIVSPRDRFLIRPIVAHTDIERVIESIKGRSLPCVRDRAIMEVLYTCGLLAGELVALQESDVDLAGGYLWVRRNQGRYVPLLRSTKRALRAWLKVKPKGAVLFTSRAGRPLKLNRLGEIVQRRGIRAGLELSPRMLRTACAVHMLNAGADIFSVGALLGHEDLRATEVLERHAYEKLKRVHSVSHPHG